MDAVISCVASRSGAPNDAWAVDYGINSIGLRAAKAAGVTQFIMLSAICVQRPLLEFQKAKLAFENELIASGLSYSIIRPTAFFKSLSGQANRLRRGKPFLVFGDGTLTACKPISDRDLARFMVNALVDTAYYNQILPIGGPGPALTPLDQGHALATALGRPPKMRHVPVGVMDAIIGVLGLLGRVSDKARAKADLARIGRYYATQSMLVWNPDTEQYVADQTPEFGYDTLEQHYVRLALGEVEVDLGDHAVF